MSAAAKAQRRAQRERRRQVARAQMERALAIACPAPECRAGVGVWCFSRGVLGPDMHERRWAAADREKP